MPIHHSIIHHVHKHKERIIAHINKHQKKYIFGAGVLSGWAITKFIALMIIFLGMSKMGGNIGADYYDAEFYATQTGEKININISDIIDIEDLDPAENIPKTETSQMQTGNLYTGTDKQGQ